MICQNCIHSDVCKDYSVYKDTIIACESFKDAKEVNSAIKKQIPKKVEKYLPFYKARCPSCNQPIDAQITKIHCYHCGQALDWK